MALQLPERGAPPSNWAATVPITSMPISTNASSASKPRRKNSSSSSVVHGMDAGVKTRTARPPASPFIVSGKGKASAGIGSGGHHHYSHGHGHGHGLGGASANGKAVTGGKNGTSNGSGGSHDVGLQEIAHITDTRRLEDMLAHSDSLVSNPNLCALLPGGLENVKTRNEAMRSRLAHLYSMRDINIGFQDSLHLQQQQQQQQQQQVLDASASTSSPHAQNGHAGRVKEEDMEASMGALSIKREALPEELGHGRPVKKEDTSPDGTSPGLRATNAVPLNYSPSGSDGIPTSLSSSPPFASGSPTSGNGFHRNWKNNIANNTRMIGRIGQLSMDESLGLLQQRVNTRLRAEAEAEAERLASDSEGGRLPPVRRTGEPAGASASAAARERRGAPRQQQALGDMQIANSVENEGSHAHTPEEEDDFDWHTEGYYHDDEEGA